MTTWTTAWVLLFVVLAVLVVMVLRAIYSEYKLKKCLVTSATPEDHIILSLWAGLLLAHHTAVADMLTISQEEFAKLTEKAARVYLRLVGGGCFDETYNAFKYADENVLFSKLRYLTASGWLDKFSDSGVLRVEELFHAYVDDRFFNTMNDLNENMIEKTRDRGRNYKEELNKCLVEWSSSRDKVLLSLWVGLRATQHQAVAHMVNISREEISKVIQEAGDAYLHLTSEMCLSESVNVLKFEGLPAYNESLQFLEEVSEEEFFLDPGIQNAFEMFYSYLSELKYQLRKKAE